MKIFVPFDFGRTLETGMGIVMSFVLNSSAMFLLGAPLTPFTILQGWVGAFRTDFSDSVPAAKAFLFLFFI